MAVDHSLLEQDTVTMEHKQRRATAPWLARKQRQGKMASLVPA